MFGTPYSECFVGTEGEVGVRFVLYRPVSNNGTSYVIITVLIPCGCIGNIKRFNVLKRTRYPTVNFFKIYASLIVSHRYAHLLPPEKTKRK
jgi:hypothetical protein